MAFLMTSDMTSSPHSVVLKCDIKSGTDFANLPENYWPQCYRIFVPIF